MTDKKVLGCLKFKASLSQLDKKETKSDTRGAGVAKYVMQRTQNLSVFFFLQLNFISLCLMRL